MKLLKISRPEIITNILVIKKPGNSVTCQNTEIMAAEP